MKLVMNSHGVWECYTIDMSAYSFFHKIWPMAFIVALPRRSSGMDVFCI